MSAARPRAAPAAIVCVVVCGSSQRNKHGACQPWATQRAHRILGGSRRYGRSCLQNRRLKLPKKRSFDYVSGSSSRRRLPVSIAEHPCHYSAYRPGARATPPLTFARTCTDGNGATMDRAELLKIIDRAAHAGATVLDLSNKGLEELPPEIGALTGLKRLNVDHNRLTALPPEIGALTSLRVLSVFGNQLTSLPSEIGALTALQGLYVNDNQLTSLPSEIGALTALIALNVVDRVAVEDRRTDGAQAPVRRSQPVDGASVGDRRIDGASGVVRRWQPVDRAAVGDRRAEAAPRPVHKWQSALRPAAGGGAEQGIGAIYAYFAERETAGERKWMSKMLLVGQGAVGKTSLLKRLRGEPFDEEEDTTRGMEVEIVFLDHPNQTGVQM